MTVTVHQFCRKPFPGAFSMERVFADIDAALPEDIVVERIENRSYSRGVLSRLGDALRAWRLQGPVNHVLGDVHYLTFLLPRRRTILTIHDCEMIDRARGGTRWLLKLFWLDIPLARAGHVVAISERTRDDIIRLAGGDPGHIRVIENPVSPSFRPVPPPDPDSTAVVLHIGTKANKNLDRLIAAAQGLPLKLLIVGRPTAAQHDLLQRSGINFETRESLSDDGLRACYAEASVLSFVSLSEGFGLPIVEAQAVGRPVLTANREPMVSVAGPSGAVFVDPEDPDAIREGLRRIIEDGALRARLIAAGARNVERFGADRIAAQYAALYREVAG